jgi:hypothetical protein
MHYTDIWNLGNTSRLSLESATKKISRKPWYLQGSVDTNSFQNVGNGIGTYITEADVELILQQHMVLSNIGR